MRICSVLPLLDRLRHTADPVRDVRADALRGLIGIHIGFDFSGMPCTTCALQDPCVAGLARTVVAVAERDSIRLEAEGLAGGQVVHAGNVGDRQKRYRGGLTGVGREVDILQRYRCQRAYGWPFESGRASCRERVCQYV